MILILCYHHRQDLSALLALTLELSFATQVIYDILIIQGFGIFSSVDSSLLHLISRSTPLPALPYACTSLRFCVGLRKACECLHFKRQCRLYIQVCKYQPLYYYYYLSNSYNNSDGDDNKNNESSSCIQLSVKRLI